MSGAVGWKCPALWCDYIPQAPGDSALAFGVGNCLLEKSNKICKGPQPEMQRTYAEDAQDLSEIISIEKNLWLHNIKIE